MDSVSFTETLATLHLFLSSANAIVAFSLFVYVITHNPPNPTTISFGVLITLVTAMWVGDAGHISIRADDLTSQHGAVFWLRVQALGLALLPAAYLHFSDTLLRSTGSLSVGRRASVVGAYVAGGAFLLLMLGTELVIARPVLAPWGTHYVAGPLYPLFAVYSIALTLWALFNFFRARHRCITASLRRRMGYVVLAFVVPALGTIPYLLVTYLRDALPDPVLTLFPVAGSVGVSVMAVVLAYLVSYQGVLLPDRVVKQSLINYLLRGPFLGVAVTFLIITIPRVGRLLGAATERFQVFAVIFVIVLLQASLDKLRPYLNRLIHQDDDIGWLEELNQRLLTSADLSELLNNTLVAVCEVLRVGSGFIVAPDRRPGEFSLRAVVGSTAKARDSLARVDFPALAAQVGRALSEENGANSHVLIQNSYWLFPLESRSEDAVIGFLAAERPADRSSLTTEEREIVQVLVERAGIAVEDVHLQRSILSTLQGVAPEIAQVQEWGSQLRYASPLGLAQLESNPLYTPDFQRAVRDALSHYWGGPKLTGNPLLNLEIVRAALPASSNNPSLALRTVLRQCIEALRPPADRDPLAAEWMLYNILHLRFLQGKRVKEIIQQLGMSESDFYRKERAAIREVAHMLAVIERDKVESQRQ